MKIDLFHTCQDLSLNVVMRGFRHRDQLYISLKIIRSNNKNMPPYSWTFFFVKWQYKTHAFEMLFSPKEKFINCPDIQYTHLDIFLTVSQQN